MVQHKMLINTALNLVSNDNVILTEAISSSTRVKQYGPSHKGALLHLHIMLANKLATLYAIH